MLPYDLVSFLQERVQVVAQSCGVSGDGSGRMASDENRRHGRREVHIGLAQYGSMAARHLAWGAAVDEDI